MQRCSSWHGLNLTQAQDDEKDLIAPSDRRLDVGAISVYGFYPGAGEEMNEDRTRDSYSHKSLRILVVEDHDDTLQALCNLLTHFGHEISVADDAQSAREIIRSKEFDVVLADIALPDGSGYELVAEAKRKRPVKAVALTGFGAPDDIERGKEAGFDFHLTKPVDFHELRAVLGQIDA